MQPHQERDIVAKASSKLLGSVDVGVDQSRQYPAAGQVDLLDVGPDSLP